ncbi:MAG: hypothetical protein GY845_38470 [Planctomycetes bacterium]|nr:hypothetical protein [Planctomycetota bacterium]
MSFRKYNLGVIVFAMALLAFQTKEASADIFAPADLPPELKPWIPWVLDEFPERFCPSVGGEAICLWPGELELDLDSKGGRFSQRVLADMEISLALPGDMAHWPQNVAIDGRSVVVLERNGQPIVRLLPGMHHITGQLIWSELPEGIQIPAEIAIVTLKVDGEEIRFPRRDEGGLLWLQSATLSKEEDERLDVTVMRKIRDGIPLSITTRIVLRASGKSREISLPRTLLKGTVPISVESSIPARIDKDGNLGLQIRAGTHIVTIVARTQGSPKSLEAPLREAPWPENEIWVWQVDEKLRQVVVSGPPGIDPSHTNLPEEWRGLPAFLISPNKKLAINTTRRGEPEPPPDQLRLERELWMDLNGGGFTVRDNISGTLSRTRRLDLKSVGILGRVAVDGTDQLITEHPTTKSPGVELRNKDLNMTAEWRIKERTRELPAVGWSEDVQSLGTTIHLPPGWTLLSASGVDELPGTWWDKWDLFGFFFVLIISLSIAKLTRWYFGLIAFVALVLCYQESDAPFIVWISLLVSLGLLKVLPYGKLNIAVRIWWWASVIWLVTVLVPFSVIQVRTGLFPQIPMGMGQAAQVRYGTARDLLPPTGPEKPRLDSEDDLLSLEGNVGAAKGVSQEAQIQRKMPRSRSKKKILAKKQAVGSHADIPAEDELEGQSQLGKSYTKYRKALQQDPKAIVQTGPGVPSWQWKLWRMSWSGPVNKDHQIKLYLVPPGIHLFLSIFRVLLLVLISIRIALEARSAIRNAPRRPANTGQGKGTATLGATALAVLLAQPSVSAAGETPDPGILTEMLERLTRQEQCRPNCVSTSLLDLRVVDGHVTLVAEVHVGAASSWRIPGPAKNWVPDSVEIDGRPTMALAHRPDGFLHVRVKAGRQKIKIQGPVPTGNSLVLEFGESPHRVTAYAPGWTVEGLREDGRAESSVQITQRTGKKGNISDRAEFEEGSYPPWLEITRTLDLGIPWLIHTQVRRISPPGTPVLVQVPLLPNESVTESELQVEGEFVVLSLGRNDTELNWSSTIEEQPEIKLVAPLGKPWTEVWVFKCSPVWQCDFKGLPPIHSKENDNLELTFVPWPGEKLNIALTRPNGVEGQSTTIDSARLELKPGIRHVTANLMLDVRSSRGGTQEITLPQGAKVQELTVGGSDQPFRQEQQKLRVTLGTGNQRIHIKWQQTGGIEPRYWTPKVSIGGHAANVRTIVNLPNDRWLLWTGGPSWGPAILFWGYLLTILLAGLILGRIKLSPLKSWQWMLLALGLTQVPMPVSLIIVLWFLALAWRAHKPLEHFVLHNAFQIVLGIWTCVAIGCLVSAVYQGLAVQPDMQVQGGDSTNTRLIWYVDRINDVFPRPWIISFPIIVWKLIMLAWALWLAGSIVKWAPWAWRSFSAVTLWRSSPPSEKRPRFKGKTKPKEDSKAESGGKKKDANENL